MSKHDPARPSSSSSSSSNAAAPSASAAAAAAAAATARAERASWGLGAAGVPLSSRAQRALAGLHAEAAAIIDAESFILDTEGDARVREKLAGLVSFVPARSAATR